PRRPSPPPSSRRAVVGRSRGGVGRSGTGRAAAGGAAAGRTVAGRTAGGRAVARGGLPVADGVPGVERGRLALVHGAGDLGGHVRRGERRAAPERVRLVELLDGGRPVVAALHV